MVEELLKTLSQLDRIEYRQKMISIENKLIIFYIIISLAMISALFGNFFSLFIYILGIYFLVNVIRRVSKLKREYFKVVKR